MGIFAPTIRYHNGRFYVITTNVTDGNDRGGNFFVWTHDPFGEWSDPVWIDLPGIDPSLFFNDDGRVYYTGTSQNIFLCEIDIETGKLLSKRKDIWSGTGGADPEGPHIYKIGDYYYLFISEGGTAQCHMVTVARSKWIDGPYEPCPRNPVLTNRSLPLPVRAIGHADLVHAHDGKWWAVCLGIRPVPYPDRHHLGRETFLVPVSWDKEGWPLFGKNGSVDLVMEADLLPQHPFPQKPVRDDFDGDKLDLCWNFLFNPDNSLWSLTERKGYLTLRGSAANLSDKETLAWVGRRQQHMACKVSTHLTFSPAENGEEAGLSIYLNNDHHYEIALTRIENSTKILFRRRIGSLWKVENCVDYDREWVIFELEASPQRYRFGYRNSQGQVVYVGQGEVHYLSTEVGGRFTGNYIALYATGNGKRCSAPAYFDWFDYQFSE